VAPAYASAFPARSSSTSEGTANSTHRHMNRRPPSSQRRRFCIRGSLGGRAARMEVTPDRHAPMTVVTGLQLDNDDVICYIIEDEEYLCVRDRPDQAGFQVAVVAGRLPGHRQVARSPRAR